MGTPTELWRSMERAWTVEPTSARIVEDIQAFPRVLEKIIQRRGCVVPDEDLRTGRRCTALYRDDKELKKKPRASQRTHTQTRPPLHPDCQEAYDSLLQSARAAAPTATEPGPFVLPDDDDADDGSLEDPEEIAERNCERRAEEGEDDGIDAESALAFFNDFV